MKWHLFQTEADRMLEKVQAQQGVKKVNRFETYFSLWTWILIYCCIIIDGESTFIILSVRKSVVRIISRNSLFTALDSRNFVLVP